MKKKAAKVPNEAKIAKLVKELLVELGEDPGRDGLKKTPERVARSLSFLTRGYRQDIVKVVNGARFKSGTNHMVILKDIELYSLCEHHMLPFYGKCAIGYISQGKVLGVSKLARIVDMYARRLHAAPVSGVFIKGPLPGTATPKSPACGRLRCSPRCRPRKARPQGKSRSARTKAGIWPAWA